MSLPLRITFKDVDYTYLVLTTGIDKETKEIKISLTGKEFTLERSGQNEWYAKDSTVGDNQELLKAITRSIVSRYRL